jgi:hypothetical protein
LVASYQIKQYLLQYNKSKSKKNINDNQSV